MIMKERHHQIKSNVPSGIIIHYYSKNYKGNSNLIKKDYSKCR